MTNDRGFCPACGIYRTITWQEAYDPAPREVPQFLYQRSYPEKPGYISPRCLKCYEKKEKKLCRNIKRKIL